MPINPWQPLDNSLFLARMQQEQQLAALQKEDEIRRQDQSRWLAENARSEKMLMESQREKEFERALKLAEMEGETSAYKGEEGPSFSYNDPQLQTELEYGSAKTGFDVRETSFKNQLSREREARLFGNTESQIDTRKQQLVAKAKELALRGDTAGAKQLMEQAQLDEKKREHDEMMEYRWAQWKLDKDKAEQDVASGGSKSLALTLPELNRLSQDYGKAARAAMMNGKEKRIREAGERIYQALTFAINKAKPDPAQEGAIVRQLLEMHKADFDILARIGKLVPGTTAQTPATATTENDDVDEVLQNVFKR